MPHLIKINTSESLSLGMHSILNFFVSQVYIP